MEPHLELKDLCTVYNAMQSARAKWYFIGLELGVDPSELESIRSGFCGDAGDSLRQVLFVVLRRVNPEPTLKRLADALDASSVGYGQLAEQVHQKYIN